MSGTKMAELLEMPFGMWTLMGQRKHVLDGGAHWHNRANTIERSTCGGDAAGCPLMSTACYDYYIVGVITDSADATW